MINVNMDELILAIQNEVKKVIVSQDDAVNDILVAMLSEGHVLLEGVPGLAKTLMAKAFSKVVGVDFKRIQFTPDLLPSDITGTKVYDLTTQSFNVEPGPIVTNFLLADEINRTPAKTQAGLLEAMTEEQITISGTTVRLPKPYMVVATQNPLEFDGTYSLPEALVDRFLLKVCMDYPAEDAEVQVLRKHHSGELNSHNSIEQVEVVCTANELIHCQMACAKVEVKDELFEYMTKIVRATREHEAVDIGASPRGAIALLNASKAQALILGRSYVIPEDIKRVSKPALRHRIFIKPEMEIEGVHADHVISDILSAIDVPR